MNVRSNYNNLKAALLGTLGYDKGQEVLFKHVTRFPLFSLTRRS